MDNRANLSHRFPLETKLLSNHTNPVTDSPFPNKDSSESREIILRLCVVFHPDQIVEKYDGTELLSTRAQVKEIDLSEYIVNES
jgi:hypothetical protein